MTKTTRATLALDRAGVAYAVRTYSYDPNADRIGVHAAESLGVEPARVLKTLRRWSTASRSVCCWPPIVRWP